MTAAVWKALGDLGIVDDGGLDIIIETRPQQLEPIDRPEITLKEGARGFVCVCGYESKDTEELLLHIRRHGATRVVVTPENWGSR